MKKCVYGIILSAALLMTGCGAGDSKVIESNTADLSAEEQTVDAGYVLEYQGLTIGVDQDASEYIDALGEASEYFESPSCAGEGIGKLYTYDDIQIQTYPEGDQDLVLYVLLLNDNVSTKEGADLSMTRDEVIAIYGEPTSEDSDSLSYESAGMTLNFLFDGDSMISIEYDSAKN